MLRQAQHERRYQRYCTAYFLTGSKLKELEKIAEEMNAIDRTKLLGNPVVFIGPNNSGKTSALQALALWEIGLKKWNEKREGKSAKRAPKEGGYLIGQ